MEATSKTASKAIQQRSAFAQVLGNESPDNAVLKIVNSANPQRDYIGLVKLARRGPEGSIDGLKAATLDYASRAATSSTGEFSFSRYRELLNQPMSGRGPSVLKTMEFNKVMSADEANRLNILLRHAERIERGIKMRPLGELIAEPDALFDLVVRAVGANIGGMSGLGQATGSPLVMAQAGSAMTRKLMEKVPAGRVMDVFMEAAKNPVFMARLLEKPQTQQRARELHKQVNAFLLQAGLIPREEQPQQQGATQ